MLALALAPLLFLGITGATAGGRTAVRGSGVVRQRVVVGWDPFWYPGFSWGLSYSYGPTPYDGYAQVPPRNAAPVELHVSPRKAAVIVDGSDAGQARDFSSRAYPLWLKAGTHELVLSYRGYQTLRVKLEAKRGRAYRIHYDLRKGEGMDPRSNGQPRKPPAK
jgi:hypothetical protein